MSVPRRLRFAPSPTGSLHLGNARTALFNWIVARQAGARLVLRIEDTDAARQREGSEGGILEDLRWLGLDWDEGPDIGGPFGPYRQSERAPSYASAAAKLIESGRAFRCFCPEDAAEAGPRGGSTVRGGGCEGGCRSLPPDGSAARTGEPFAVRLRTVPEDPSPADLVVRFDDLLRGPVEFPATELGEPVLVRRDGRPTYNFAVVVDDVAMGITTVIRGDDHLSNTPKQVLLFRALAADPPEFAHLPLVRGPDGERLSKRHGATSVAELRAQGIPAEAVVNALALLGWAPGPDQTIVEREQLLREFELRRVQKSAAIFDPAKLDWISGQYVHRMDLEHLATPVAERLSAKGWIPSDAAVIARDWILAIAEFVRPAIDRLDQAPTRCEALFLPRGIPASEQGVAALREPGARAVLDALAAELHAREPRGPDDWARLKSKVQEATGLKGKALYHPLRAAITGEASGPELDKLVPLILEGHLRFPDRIASLRERLRLARRAVA